MKYKTRFFLFFFVMVLFNLAANFAHPVTPTVIQDLKLCGGVGEPDLGDAVVHAADQKRHSGGYVFVDLSPEGRQKEVGEHHGRQGQSEHVIMEIMEFRLRKKLGRRRRPQIGLLPIC